ncbi:hypothetical protein EVAR_53057_1 [Eumeta japonica]|uniref:Uncharacterized protein n=1 Tax=Eumeta variegata TaxID=151549 RepID=A0A4C1YRT1_EUMVA|nr:hypothetical protein EVAR_53057_1 [Eumeta japonica]
MPLYCSALSLARSAQAERDNELCFFVRAAGVHRFIRRYHVNKISCKYNRRSKVLIRPRRQVFRQPVTGALSPSIASGRRGLGTVAAFSIGVMTTAGSPTHRAL